MKKIYLICILVVILFLSIYGKKERILSNQKWLEDLNCTVKLLKSTHPYLYYRISEDEFNKIVNQSKLNIRKAVSDHEAYFIIKKVIASIQDGHTQLLDQGVINLRELRFPFLLGKFEDGVFITVIRNDYQKYFGSKVVSINEKPIEQVLKITSSVINMDNKFGLIPPSVNLITFAQKIFGLEIIDSEEEINLELITTQNERRKIKVKSVWEKFPRFWPNRLTMAPTKGEYIDVAKSLGKNTPLYLKKQDKNSKFYWFEHLRDSKTIYFQYNQVDNQPGNPESFSQFTERLWDYIDQNRKAVDKLVIDIRFNDGGNGRMMTPFINHIIKRDFINKRGKLFVLVGNRTYSAPVILMTELVVHTEAIFVGTPPASPFNFFSNRRIVGRLPNSDFQLGIASLQIAHAWPYQPEYFQPDIPSGFTSKEYFSGKDPAMDIILNGNGLLSVEDIAADYGVESALEFYKKNKAKFSKYEWWTAYNQDILESRINQQGYNLMVTDKKKAYQIFKLNTILFPKSPNVWDSFAEINIVKDKVMDAIKFYKKSLDLNPENDNARKMLNKLIKK